MNLRHLVTRKIRQYDALAVFIIAEKCKDIPIWVWILCPFIAGLGILTAWLILEKCGLKTKCCKYLRVRSVTLNDRICLPSKSLHVVSGEPKTLHCTSISKPAATIVWYIGKEEKQRSSSSRGTSFTFIPQTSDHGQKIYCEAFNIQPESQAVTSNKLTLNVLGRGDVKPREDKPKDETQSGNQRTGQQRLENRRNKSKESEIHIKNEQHDQGKKIREQPPIPEGATGTTTLHGRPMLDTPKGQGSKGHDSQVRGLSANFDDDHPLVDIDTPPQRAGALKKIKEDSL